MNLLRLIGQDVELKRVGVRHGGEYAGPCPLCRTGRDRFRVWPHQGRWACLGPKAGRAGCDKGGDAAAYLQERDHLTYPEAAASLGLEGPVLACGPQRPAQPVPRPTQPPGPAWQARADIWIRSAHNALLMAEHGARPRHWLHRRGITKATIQRFQLGYIPRDRYEPRGVWGLPQDPHLSTIWLPAGILIPWRSNHQIWRLNIRRPLTPDQIARGEPKYMGPAGSANALYNADALRPGRPAVLVEGEFDALIIHQAAGDLVAPVATGSTGGGRDLKWLGKLAMCSRVLVAFDVDANQAGERAAQWWLETLPNARRWRPLWDDVNGMATAGADVRAWVKAGLAG